MKKTFWLFVLCSFFSSSSLFAEELETPSTEKEPRSWIAERWEKPRKADYVNATVLATINAAGYAATAYVLQFPIRTAAGVIVYQTLVTAADTSFLHFQDNIYSNRPAGGEPQFSKKTEFVLRMLRQWTVAQGMRWVSGPIMQAAPAYTWLGQQEILWNVAATGISHSFVGIQRSRHLNRDASRLVNLLSFALIGGFSTLDILGVHLFDIPYLSQLGIHGSNLLVWGAGFGLGAFVANSASRINSAAKKIERRSQQLANTCSQFLSTINPKKKNSK